jgi:hypothetical protein
MSAKILGKYLKISENIGKYISRINQPDPNNFSPVYLTLKPTM